MREGNLMMIRIRAALLVLVMLGAAYTAAEAFSSLRPVGTALAPDGMYESLFSEGMEAEYYLKSCDGFVAVYPGIRARTPESITAIETSQLRLTDRALLERGIPVYDRETLLELLEDLGS